MKIKVLIITCLLVLSGVYVKAQDEYIVKIRNSANMLSLETSQKDTYVEASWEEVCEYLEEGIVEYYEPVMYAQYLGNTNWQVINTNGTFAEKVGTQGCSVKVAVVDGGMTVYNSIRDRILEGYDFHKKTTDVTDENGHGTFVASMIALEGSAFAYESYIVPLKVFYSYTDLNGKIQYTATSNDVAQAVRAAVDTYGCDVINLSLSFYSSPQVLKDAIDYAVGRGAIVVAAAGNDGDSKYHYPAAYPNVTGVGSTNYENNVAYFSQRNDSVHVVAPGEDVVVTPAAGRNNVGSGTSFSAPQVSALAAVAKCIRPELTNSEFMELLKVTSVHPNDADLTDNIYTYDVNYGYGLINCRAFIKKMVENQKVLISPVKIKGKNAYSIVYNNTGEELCAKGICVTQENIKVTDLNFDSDEALPLSCEYTEGAVKNMVWSGFDTLVPLSPVVEINKESLND